MRRSHRSGNSVFREPWYVERYDLDLFGGRFGRYLLDREVELFCSMLEGGDGAILDAGAGTGKLSFALLERERDVISVDFSTPMLRLVKAKVAAKGLRAKCSTSDIQALCFKDQAFACTACSRVLMHLKDWRSGIAELCRVTRRQIILDFPPRLSIAWLGSFWKHSLLRHTQGTRRAYQTFYVREVVGELGKHGFIVIGLRRSHFLPVLLHRWLDNPLLSRKVEGALAKLRLVDSFGAPVTLTAVRADMGQPARTS